MSNLFDRVLTLQKVPQGGFAYINGTQGIPLNSGMQFYIDSVSTGFYPPVSPLSADPNKYRKQKWLSVGLEGNSFRRYINENIHLNGIPSGLEPGHFVYFTIEPKSSLLEQGAGTENPRNLRYISSLRAKPYMVVQNDANRDNSYERTPSNLFTGVSGNNNFVRFHPNSKYKNLALQALRFHPVIGHGYANYNVCSGRLLNITPKNHHLETFIEVSYTSGSKINYGNDIRRTYGQNMFPLIHSGKGLHVAGALELDANGIYVANNRNISPNYYTNQNNYRIYNSGASNIFVLAKPNTSLVSITGAPNAIDFTNIHRTSGALGIPSNFRKHGDLAPTLEYSQVGWMSLTGSNENLTVSRLVTSQFSPTDSLYLLGRANISSQDSGSYLAPKLGTISLPFTKIGKQNANVPGYIFITDVRGFQFNAAVNLSYTSSNGLRYFSPYYIFDDQELNYFPYTTTYTMQNQINIKERINFKRPLSSNLHQAKKVNMIVKFDRDDRAKQVHRVIKNFNGVEERLISGYNRVLEFYDEKDNDTYSATPFYSISAADYAFEQQELFIYKSRPDFNNPSKQNVVRWYS